MKCPNCGETIPDHSDTCTFCQKSTTEIGAVGKDKKEVVDFDEWFKKNVNPEGFQEAVKNKIESGEENVTSYKDMFVLNLHKIVLLVAAFVLAIILLFPPFYFERKGTRVNKGYDFILSPPRIASKVYAVVNSETLITQSLIVVFIGILCYFALKPSKTNKSEPVRNSE